MYLRLFLLLLLGLQLWACKDKVEGNAEANFNLTNTVLLENNALQIINMSKNANTLEWTIKELGYTYYGEQPKILMDSAGKFTLQLKAKGGNGSLSIKEVGFEVLVDTMWRICNNSKKIWTIKSILYNGVEQINEDCKLDDNLIFNYYNSTTVTDSFELNEGTKKCASGSYLFGMPSAGIWQFNKKTRSIDMAIEVVGNPANFNFKIEKLYKNYLKAVDNGNNAKMLLIN